jgi:hypothetical protein
MMRVPWIWRGFCPANPRAPAGVPPRSTCRRAGIGRRVQRPQPATRQCSPSYQILVARPPGGRNSHPPLVLMSTERPDAETSKAYDRSVPGRLYGNSLAASVRFEEAGVSPRSAEVKRRASAVGTDAYPTSTETSMSKKIKSSLFENHEQAEITASRLENAGIGSDHISVTSDTPPHEHRPGSDSARYAAPLLVGVPVYPAVPIAGVTGPRLGIAGSHARTALTSADADRTAGTRVSEIAGWLVAEGVDRSDAEAYAEGVRRGGALLTVRCDEAEVDRVVSIADGDRPLDIDERQTSWRSEGRTSRTSS